MKIDLQMHAMQGYLTNKSCWPQLAHAVSMLALGALPEWNQPLLGRKRGVPILAHAQEGVSGVQLRRLGVVADVPHLDVHTILLEGPLIHHLQPHS